MRRALALLAVFLLAAGCGGVTAQALEAAAQESGAELGGAQDAGALEAALEGGGDLNLGLGGDAGAGDVLGGDGLEAPAARPKCSGTKTISHSGSMGVGSQRCKDYAPGLICATLCHDENSIDHPTAAELPACEAPGLPVYNGTIICVPSCSSCP